MSQNLGRRGFVKWLGSIVTAIGGTTLASILPETKALATSETEDSALSLEELLNAGGEVYAGFLLLPSPDSGIPRDIVPGRPIGLHGTPSTAVRGEEVEYGSPNDMRREIGFRTYSLRQAPESLSYIGSSALRFSQSHGVWSAENVYGVQTRDDEIERRISVVAVTEFPQPVPLWPVRDPSHQPTLDTPEEIFVAPKKLSIPTIGECVALPSQEGHVLQWIEDDVLFSLIAEHDSSEERMLDLASSLTEL